MEPLKRGNLVRIIKGSRARNTHANEVWEVIQVLPLGKEYGYSVEIRLAKGGRFISWYARHPNRLSDTYINLNDGNPLHKIQIVRR